MRLARELAEQHAESLAALAQVVVAAVRAAQARAPDGIHAAPVAPDGLAACSLDVQIRAGHTQTITLRKTSSFRVALVAAERFAQGAITLDCGYGKVCCIAKGV